jgi:hypothetical protein
MRSSTPISKQPNSKPKKPTAASFKFRRGRKPRSRKPAPTRHGNALDPVPCLFLAWKYGSG